MRGPYKEEDVTIVKVGRREYAVVGLAELLPSLEQVMEYRVQTEETLVVLILTYLDECSEHLDTRISFGRLMELYDLLRKLEYLIVLSKEGGNGGE